jgi:hypothetical protein
VTAGVDHIAYSYDPILLLGSYRDDATILLPLEPSAHPTPDDWEAAWDPLFLSSMVNAPRHLVGGVPHHLQARFKGIEMDGPYRWHFVEHHLAHAASAFHASPFMLFVYDVQKDKADSIPAVRHVDGTARIQTINHSQHPLYYELLKAFHARTGMPVLVNTSFNARGEPIVCSPRDAVECFWTSPFDALAIVIVTRNRRDSLMRTLSHLRSLEEQFPIVVVDNDSTDDTVGMVRQHFPQVQLVRLAENRGAVVWNVCSICESDWIPVRHRKFVVVVRSTGARSDRSAVKTEEWRI